MGDGISTMLFSGHRKKSWLLQYSSYTPVQFGFDVQADSALDNVL